ncbi:polyprenol monophosphomannose synthase [Candidatus Laterigemmans baculatus]|uniref:polyprenol monophosphomannose synthase n=1 Tax=Candidatus Laterigemmans baculatus TaxID=2770505 RepID=UPI0013DA93FB|nr:polyprenol monophosphomannose synthase [Candidatus Laterigemmans baculatus]
MSSVPPSPRFPDDAASDAAAPDDAVPDDAALSEQPAERLLVAVCTYNERSNLPDLVAAIHHSLPEADILVVDDDSPDGTGRWAAEQSETVSYLRTIIRSDQRGLGGALREAIRDAVANRYAWLLNLDGDFSHDPADLPRLLERARDPEAPVDVVVGTRYATGGRIEGWPLRRRVMSRMVNRFATGILRLPVSDCSGSLRCYRVAALERIEPETLRSNGYAIFEELLVRLARLGSPMAEVPITFHERRHGASKLSPGEALRAASQIVHLAFRRG